MSIDPISSVTSSTSAAALLAAAVSLPANTVIAAVADTPIQIQSEISQLEQDEEVPSGGQSLPQIQLDIQVLEQAERLRGEKTAELGSTSSQGVAESATPSSPVSTDHVVHLNAQA